MFRFLTALYGVVLRRLGLAGDFSRLTLSGSDVPWVAVALQRSTPCLTHSGIVYRERPGTPLQILHLGGHLALSGHAVTDGFIYAVPELLDEDQEFLAGFCRRILRANGSRSIPYSFDYDPDITFDRVRGTLVTSDAGQGLSCATFVAAVFRSAGVPLILLSSWPSQADADDSTARRAVLEWWRRSGKPHLIARAAEIEPSIRARRVRPEHVAGACLQPLRFRPAAYHRCHRDGIEVLARWDAACPPPDEH